MKKIIVALLCLILVLQSCFDDPVSPQPYHAKGIVIGEEKCNVDSSKNYWLLDLSIENNSPETGDTITYDGVVYEHVFRTINLDDSLRQHGKKVDIDFNFSTNDHSPTQPANCYAPNAETFLLIDIILFDQAEIN